MYNGIGLTSVRGSGTNGYVQKNLAHVSRVKTARAKSMDKPMDRGGDLQAPKKANTEILEHNRKREVEVKVMRLRETLEEQGAPDADVDAQCDKLRSELMARLPPPRSGGSSSGAGGRAGETHADAPSAVPWALTKSMAPFTSQRTSSISWRASLGAPMRESTYTCVARKGGGWGGEQVGRHAQQANRQAGK